MINLKESPYMLFELQNINYVQDSRSILKNINLTIEAGSNITITGPSGSGKSTLGQIIASLRDPTDGYLFYQERSALEYNPIEYRREVAYCVQQPTLFGDTVLDNFKFPYQIRKLKFGDAEKEIVASYLELVQLKADFMERPIFKLSGGERQRVALLRNVLFEPKVLILDEITAGLDRENKQIIYDLIRHFNKDKKMTIIQITHDLAEIKMAHHLIKMVKGEIASVEVSEV